MKLFRIALVALVLLVNLVVAQPSWADRPKLTQTTDYAEVNQALNELLKAKETPEESGYTAEEIQQKIGDLRLQKYILETAADWSQCRNETGNTLAVYAHKPKKYDAGNSTLYFLANGDMTDDGWNCDGVYLPSGIKVAGVGTAGVQGQELTEPLAFKIVPGTQLVAKTNLETGTVEFNVPPSKVFKAGEVNWSIPDMSLADISSQIPNAPIDD